MAKKEVCKQEGHCCGLYCPCGKITVGHMFVKMFLALVIIAFVLALSMQWVLSIDWKATKASKRIQYYAPRAVEMEQKDRFYAMRTGGVGMIIKDGEMPIVTKSDMIGKMPTRIYASIVKIQGNQITVMTNAAAEQIVMSEAETVIVVSSTETGIDSLQPGQNLIIFGSMDEEDVLRAKIINVQ